MNQKNNESASKSPGPDELKAPSGYRFFDPMAILFVFIAWAAGGALLAYAWWNVSLFEKYIWAFVLWIWIIISPFVLTVGLWILSVACLFTGRMGLCLFLGNIACGIYKLLEVPCNWFAIRLPTIVTDMHAVCLVGACKFGEAEELTRETIAKRELRHGQDSPALCESLAVLGEVLKYQGRYVESEKVFKRAVRIFLTDENSLSGGQLYYNMGCMYEDAELYEVAEDCLLKAIAETIKLHKRGGDNDNLISMDSSVALYYSELGEVYSATGRFDEADNCFEKAKPGHAKGISEMMEMCWYRKVGILRIRQGRVKDAEPLIRDTCRITDKLCRSLDTERLDSIKAHALFEQASGRRSESLKLLEEALALSTKVYGRSHPQTARVLSQYATVLDGTEAATMEAEAQSIRQRVLSELQGELRL